MILCKTVIALCLIPFIAHAKARSPTDHLGPEEGPFLHFRLRTRADTIAKLFLLIGPRELQCDAGAFLEAGDEISVITLKKSETGDTTVTCVERPAEGRWVALTKFKKTIPSKLASEIIAFWTAELEKASYKEDTRSLVSDASNYHFYSFADGVNLSGSTPSVDPLKNPNLGRLTKSANWLHIYLREKDPKEEVHAIHMLQSSVAASR